MLRVEKSNNRFLRETGVMCSMILILCGRFWQRNLILMWLSCFRLPHCYIVFSSRKSEYQKLQYVPPSLAKVTVRCVITSLVDKV